LIWFKKFASTSPKSSKDTLFLSQPHFGQVWGWSPTLGKVGDLESSGTPKFLELDIKGKNNLHWGVLGVVEKVSKRRYRKCPRIGISDICSPSYGQKKGRESHRDNFGTISGLHFGSPGNLCHLDVGAAERRRVYYMGDGGGIPRVRAVVSLVVRSARGLSQHQRVSRKVN